MSVQRWAAITVLLACGSPTAQAASPCVAITNDGERLKCYDTAATAPASKVVSPPADDVIVKAKAAITKNLKDGPSARFEGVVKRPGAVCGWVNAKNSMGGYTGRRPFVYMIKENHGWIIEVGSPGVMDGIKAAETHCTDVPGF